MDTKEQAPTCTGRNGAHTPGPWKVGVSGLFNIYIDFGDAASGRRALVLPANVEPWRIAAEDQANARLIAAAPDLLAALKDAVRSSRKDFNLGSDGDRQHREAYAEQFAAIAKAEGRSDV